MSADKNYFSISKIFEKFKFIFLHDLSMYMRCMR